MEKVFIYWDNSNIFDGAQEACEELEDAGAGARSRVRINFKNLLRLAHAGRPIEKAIAAGYQPPEINMLWNRMEHEGVKMELIDRGVPNRGEQGVPDRFLQLRMLEHALDYNGDPGVIVLLTGDGKGYESDTGFHRTLKRMHDRKWRIEVISWRHTCNRSMREWVEENGTFIALDDFYSAITFLEPSRGDALAPARDSSELDLSRRQTQQ